MKTDFAVSLRGMLDATLAKAEEVKVKAVIETQNRIKVRTPVDTGRLRANWLLGNDVMPTGTVEIGGGADAAPDPGARILYLANNLPYARRIEYGFTGADSLGRSYNQAGRGMVGLTVLEWPDIVKAAVASVK